MNLDRRQIAVISTAAAFVVVFAALAFFLFRAVSARAAAASARDEALEAVTRYYSAKVFPSLASLAAVKSNETELAVWRATARQLAGRGDRVLVPDSATAFKQRLQAEVRRLGSLPGGADGRLAAPTFLFGFDKYLGDTGVLPEARDIPKLQTQLDLVSHVVGVFADLGVLEVKSVKRDESPAVVPPPPPRAKPGNVRKGPPLGEDPPVTHLTYSFQFLARPSTLVQVVNALTADLRFIVITDLSFTETADGIVEKIAARDAAREAASSGRSTRSSRRRHAETTAKEDEAAKKDERLVVDPEIDAPIQVDLSLAVYDFGCPPPVIVAPVAAPLPPVEGGEPVPPPAAGTTNAPVAEAKIPSSKADVPVAVLEPRPVASKTETNSAPVSAVSTVPAESQTAGSFPANDAEAK